jgi:GTP-binding protein
VDIVKIVVQGGRGGDGAVSFRREKYIPRGGPDGGNGGRGGSVYVMASPAVEGLEVFKGRRLFKAGDGGRGQGQKRRGRNGVDLVIEIPVGTEVSALGHSGEETIVADAVSAGQKVLVAVGGAGGLGNAAFATPTHQAPEKATTGRPGEERQLILRLKYVVDVAIIGLPNSGKSTLLGALTAARPKTAGHPFTTKVPILGTAEIGDERMVLAELPALVAGSSQGRGLGNRFLVHAERAAVLLILLDGASGSLGDDLKTLESELGKWTVGLSGKSRLVVVNKTDLPEVKAGVSKITSGLGKVAPVYVSALTGEGLEELKDRLAVLVRNARAAERPRDPGIAVFRPKPVDEGGR